MKYPSIKRSGMSHAELAEAFGYKTVESFRNSGKNRSAYHQMMQGLEVCLGRVYSQMEGEMERRLYEVLKEKYENISK